MTDRPLHHCVIAGGSIAGLLAARVLSAHFDRVTLIERDGLARSPEPRNGVPQGRHIHVLLIQGRLILEKLFPGLETDLLSKGAVLLNGGRDLAWHHAGEWRTHYETDLSVLSMSRPLLETAIAERVQNLRNVTLREGIRVEGLTGGFDNAISGVHVSSRGDRRRVDEIHSDLVVDAMGRGSATGQWLSKLGFAAPESELVGARVSYASCTFRRPGQERRAVLVSGAPEKRAGALFPIEGDRWLATLISFFDEPTPQDHESFLSFARSLKVSDIYEAIRGSEPTSGIVHHHFPGSLRRRYEKLERLPDGLIVLGDGVCSFNPVYGQGMTVSALEAEALDRELARARSRGGIESDFGRRWFRANKPVVDIAWDGVLLEDLRFPELVGQTPTRLRPLQWYIDRVHRATYRSPLVTDQFYRVINFLDPPASLFRGRVMADVLFGGWRADSASIRADKPPSPPPPAPESL